jgi:hypothetical protein
MKAFPFQALVLIFLCGCVNHLPLTGLPNARQMMVHVEPSPDSKEKVVFSTALGRNAELAGSGGGLIGFLVGTGIAASDERGGAEIVRNIRATDGNFEPGMIVNAINAALRKSEIHVSDSADANRTLLVRVNSVGLLEPQRNFWVVTANVSARLENTNKTSIWSATVDSTGTHTRRMDDFARDPSLYAKDFEEVADDIARQLIAGPIR